MNQAPLEHLLQVTATRQEPIVGPQRTREGVPAFESHFRQANATSSSAPSFPPPPPSPPSAAQQTTPRTSPQRSASPSASESSPTIAEPQRQPTSSATDQSAASAPADAEPADEVLEGEAAAEANNTPTDDSDENDEVAALLAIVQTLEAASAEITAEPLATAAETVEVVAAPAPQKKDANQVVKSKMATLPAKAALTLQQDTRGDNGQAEVSDPKPTPPTDSADSKQAAVAKAADQTAQEAFQANVEAATNEHSTEVKRQSSDRESSTKSAEAAGTITTESSSATSRKAPTSIASPVTGAPTPAIKRVDNSEQREKKPSSCNDVSTVDAASAPRELPAATTRAAESAVVPVVTSMQAPQTAATPSGATPTIDAAKPSATGEGKPGILSSLTRLERGAGAGTRGAHHAGQHEATPHVDPARFISRVSRAIQTAHERGGPLQLRLSPPELGAMRIELSVNQGALTATVEADSQSAKQILLDNLPALRDRLADQNIKVERFEVDVRRDSTGSQQQNYAPRDRDQSQRQSSNANSSTLRNSSSPAADDEPPPVRRTISSTSINVVA